MLRTMLVNLGIVAIAVAGGVGGCRLAGVAPHGREAAAAAGVVLVASALAGTVLGLGRVQPPTPAGPAMTALLALVAHLAATLLLSLATVLTAGVAAVPFAVWAIGLFWATLLGLAGVCVRAVRVPPPVGG